MSLRILVTGGAGFIGSEVVRQLLVAGHSVTVLDNLVNGKRENVPDCPLVVGDVRDRDEVSRLMAGQDMVFHLACLGVRHSIHAPTENHHVNATGTLTLLECARASDVARFVYISTSEVYGTAQTVPMTEAHPTSPCTVYGAGKLAGEGYALAFFKTYAFPTVVVRPFNTYGPRCHHEGDSGEVIPRFLLRMMAGQPAVVFGDGQQTRDFTFVSDTAAGIIAAGFSAAATGNVYNLGFGEEHTILSVAEHVAALLQKEPHIEHDAPRPGDVLRLYADTRKARESLGYNPAVTLADGLERLKQWYDDSGKRPEELLEAMVVRNWVAHA